MKMGQVAQALHPLGAVVTTGKLYKSAAASLRAATARLSFSTIALFAALLTPRPAAGAKTAKSWGPATPFSLATLRRALLSTCMGASLGLVAPCALAQTVPADDPLPDDPGAGANFVLGGDAIIDTKVTVIDTLTITSASGGSTIKLDSTLADHAFIQATSSSNIEIKIVGDVVFDGTDLPNNAVAQGSLIYNNAGPDYGDISLGWNSGATSISITNMMTATGVGIEANGGAIYSTNGNVYIGDVNSVVTLSNNTSKGIAAVIYTKDDTDDAGTVVGGKVTIQGSTITVQGNRAEIHSGAIYTGKEDADITIGNDNGSTLSVNVSGNTAGGSGGAIQAAWGAVTINAKEITLASNEAQGWVGDHKGAGSGSGGAILGSRAVTIGNAASTVTITGNKALGKGGAIYTSNQEFGDVIINGSTITLSGNESGLVSTPEDYAGYLGGGAIYANKSIKLNGGAITMSNNKAQEGSGGALEAEESVTITGSMQATNNTALGNADLGTTKNGYGGAIWAGTDVTLRATTGNIEFRDNQAAGDGGAIRAGGNVTLEATGGNIIFQGNTAGVGGDAIWFQNSHKSAHSNATATFNAASGRTITFFDSIANNPDPLSDSSHLLLEVNKTGAGSVVFDNNTSPIYGTTNVQNGAFVVRNGAIYGATLDTGDEDASFKVSSGATLAGGGTGEVRANEFTLGGTLNISGSSLNLTGHPAAGNASGGYSTFTLTTNELTFSPGSQVRFNTYLNDGSTQLTDKLVLDLRGGTTSGTAAVYVNGTGGGAITDGDGILLVETNDSSTLPGTFTLADRVVAGPYEYKLFRGGLDPEGNNPEDWFLRSNLRDEPNTPNYREETSTYTAIPPLTLLYGQSVLGTLHERAGEEEDIRGRADLRGKKWSNGNWGRAFAVRGKYNGDKHNTYGDDPKYKYDFVGLQIGHEVYRSERDDGSRRHAGVYFAYGHTDGAVTHFDGARGSNRLNAFTFGGYWTHFGQSSWYVDTVLQGTYYEIASSSKASGIHLDTNGLGLAVSVEGGKPFRFNNGWFVEPQAQLIYQTVSIDSAYDAGAKVKFEDVDSLAGRIGARFGRTWMRDNDRQMTAWIRPNIWREFRGKTITKFSSDDGPVPFHSNLNGTSGELNVGVSGQYSRNTTLFLNLSYNERFDGKAHSYNAKVGVRKYW